MKLLTTAAAALIAGGLLWWFRPAAPSAAMTASSAGWSGTYAAATRSVRASPAARALVYVAGEVARPGVYALHNDARVRDAVALAGGMRPGADPVGVNLAAHVTDGDEIVVPQRGVAPPARARGRRGAAGPQRRAHKGRAHAASVPPPGPIDLNAADAATLATIPGIGPGLAERIVAFRLANGAFASPDELLDVAGFTDRRLDAVLPYVVAH